METTQNDPSEHFYEEFSTFDRDCKTVNMICIDNCDKTVKNTQRKSVDNSPCFPPQEVEADISIASSPKKRGCQSTKDLLNQPGFKRQECILKFDIDMIESK
jgi:hypothetical protein